MTREIEQKSRAESVLSVFQKVNPSAVGIEDPATWREYSSKLMRRFTDEYKLPIRVFQGASVLDVGCGTGEKSLVLASWGANVTGIDFNEQALRRARHLASISSFPARLVFHQCSLPELPEPIRDQEFDICHVDSVLHHVPDPIVALNVVAARVAVGGWLVVRNYQSITSFQRLLKRMIVRLGAGEDDEMIVANTKRLFDEDVKRSVALGGRTEDQAIYDNFVNPGYTPFAHRAILQLCQTHGFQVYAMTPTVDASAFLGPGSITYRFHEANLARWWWGMALARAMITTEPALSFLEHGQQPLQACFQACADLEDSLDGFIDEPTGEGWDRVIEGVYCYLSAFHTAFTFVYKSNENQVKVFLEELRTIQPIIRDCIERGVAPEAIPETSVLFRKMSGFPMANWVLWRPESPLAAVPFAILEER